MSKNLGTTIINKPVSITSAMNDERLRNKEGKPRPAFYILELPITLNHNKKNQEQLGYKFGKSQHLEGIVGRLRSYYNIYGDNVRVLHIRVFNIENNRLQGARDRATNFEKEVSRVLKQEFHTLPVRGAEYYKTLKPITDAVQYVDQEKDLLLKQNNIKSFKDLKTGDKIYYYQGENDENGKKKKGKINAWVYVLKYYNKEKKKWVAEWIKQKKPQYYLELRDDLKDKQREGGWGKKP